MTEARDYHDKILILSGDERIELPLHALIPAPRFEFERPSHQGHERAAQMEAEARADAPGAPGAREGRGVAVGRSPSPAAGAK